MAKYQTILVTGTDTGVGKTFITAGLARALKKRGLSVGVYKPLESGWPKEGRGSDAECLARAAGGTQKLEEICLYPLKAPLSPLEAARQEKRDIDTERILAKLRGLEERFDIVLVEGAGGLLTPLAPEWTILDLARSCSAAVLVVAANRLGCLNHALLTERVLLTSGLNILGFVLNNTAAPADESAATNRDILAQWSGRIVWGPIDHFPTQAADPDFARKVVEEKMDPRALLFPRDKKNGGAGSPRLRLAVMGHPVEHSASPAIYNAAFRHLGIEAELQLLDAPDFDTGIETARRRGFSGLAVTIPHKKAARDLADEIDPWARKVGAANTLLFGERIFAANTDAPGIIEAFALSGYSFACGCVVILGAGGAARAAAVAAAEGGAGQIIVLARTLGRGREMARDIFLDEKCKLELRPFVESDIRSALARAEILINATPVGLGDADANPVNPDFLHHKLVVMDAIYRPAGTRLMRESAARCAAAIPGTRMFIAQAALQFRLFTGREAPREIMEKALKEVPGCDWP